MSQVYTNINEALVDMASTILNEGTDVVSRNGNSRELLFNHLSILRPWEDQLIVDGRNNNPVAAIAETMWVLSGRNDVEFLQHYLPRAKDFSDDGLTWRAGYGPRLRDFHGVDQVMEVYQILKENPASRQAVINIFDPSEDFKRPTKDVPCNNWLNFQVRDGRLNMGIAVRSNDLIWGMSGINYYEWSALQAMLAEWLGVDIGTQSWFQGSLHIYENYYNIAERFSNPGYYDSHLKPSSAAFGFPSPEELDKNLDYFFKMEELIRINSSEASEPISCSPTGFARIDDALRLISLYWFVKTNNPKGSQKFRDELAKLPEDIHHNFKKYLRWINKGKDLYLGVRETVDSIMELSAAKSKAYGNSWKRRGEVFSIIPNILRKTDRIGNLVLGSGENSPSLNESVFDTFCDTFVYAALYLTWLKQGDIEDEVQVAHSLMKGYVDRVESGELDCSLSLQGASYALVETAEDLADLVEAEYREGTSTHEEKVFKVERLLEYSLVVIANHSQTD